MNKITKSLQIMNVMTKLVGSAELDELDEISSNYEKIKNANLILKYCRQDIINILKNSELTKAVKIISAEKDEDSFFVFLCILRRIASSQDMDTSKVVQFLNDTKGLIIKNGCLDVPNGILYKMYLENREATMAFLKNASEDSFRIFASDYAVPVENSIAKNFAKFHEFQYASIALSLCDSSTIVRIVEDGDMIDILNILFQYGYRCFDIDFYLPEQNREEIKQAVDNILKIFHDKNKNPNFLFKFLKEEIPYSIIRKALWFCENKADDDDIDFLSDNNYTVFSYIAKIYGKWERIISTWKSDAIHKERSRFLVSALLDKKYHFLNIVDQVLSNDKVYDCFFSRSFSTCCNLNDLTEKDLKEGFTDKNFLLDYVHNLVTERGSKITFRELKELLKSSRNGIDFYFGLEGRIDDKLVLFKHLAKKNIFKYFKDQKKAASAFNIRSLKKWEEKYSAYPMTRKQFYQTVELHKETEPFLQELHSKNDTAALLYGLNENSEVLQKDGLSDYKKEFCRESEISKWIRDFTEDCTFKDDDMLDFCLSGSADIAKKYVESDGGRRNKTNMSLIVKACLHNKLDVLKYSNLEGEVGKTLSSEMQESWKKDISVSVNGYEAKEYSDFNHCMSIGTEPVQTCMSYISGCYNECLLSVFDANKKVLLVKNRNGMIVGRALLRLTKISESDNHSDVAFVDVTDEQAGVENKSKSFFTCYLERPYISHVDSTEKKIVLNALVELAKEKAKELGCRIAISYEYNCSGNISTETKVCRVYISKSKNGKQYLDSFGGENSNGGYYKKYEVRFVV